eukprot:CAMPEP_0119307846 /NCGR_PEP_ID=MMETSP1333-20130426/8228_1 /TAXON_ID=418940 /ORGANISM="Scyphosphaera apsteinii, Strain RCC1455" /LENGTH=297 /DNA_ID=CAMNT_0007311483 /DNA_START=109 /DNA_END=1002 /DNA_ORIENTATION=-
MSAMMGNALRLLRAFSWVEFAVQICNHRGRGPGSKFYECSWGSDCFDCGKRPPAPPAPPPFSPGVECSEECVYTNDNLCDDGGPGSEYNECSWGSDCSDCGKRPPAPPPPPPAPRFPPGVECREECEYPSDDICDDGGPGSQWDFCLWGTDCADCGARPPAPPAQPSEPPKPPSRPPYPEWSFDPCDQIPIIADGMPPLPLIEPVDIDLGEVPETIPSFLRPRPSPCPSPRYFDGFDRAEGKVTKTKPMPAGANGFACKKSSDCARGLACKCDEVSSLRELLFAVAIVERRCECADN